jgi:tRNA (guanine26-N2/guanine27-N2)-dimethyltransferase
MILEGGVRLRVARGKPTKRMPVFYNPAKRFDRDLSVLFLRAFQKVRGKRLELLDLLAASGVRGLRFAIEARPGFVLLNDLNPKAFKAIQMNLKLNKEKIKCKVEIMNLEANRLLYERKRFFDYIDVDPFGSPNPFLDASVRFVRRRGVLAITSTDTAPLCGTYPSTCLRKYSSLPMKTEYCHEIGLRILAKKVIEVGAQYEIAMEPIFAHSTNHYFRVYFQKEIGAKRCDRLLERIGFIFHCEHCLRRTPEFPWEEVSSICSCARRFKVAGPLWLGNLWSKEICRLMKKLAGAELGEFLNLISEEEKVGIPTFFTTSEIARVYKIDEPRLGDLLKNLRERGFLACGTHLSPKGFRTNASIEQILSTISSP